jgi:DNA mismatch endonuclease, patch repair protein
MAASSTPSFRGLRPSSAASSYAKQRNRSIDTAHEWLVRRLLWKRGLRYRKHLKILPGRPDIAFTREQVAVFCDGDFWHGRDWRRLSSKLRDGANASYWLQKIKTNRDRDRRNACLLKRAGWMVVRIWETDVHKDPEQAARMIEEIVRSRRQAIKG